MKKIIFFTILTFLIAGILVGCASINTKTQTREYYDAYNPDLKKAEAIKKIVYSPTVSYENYSKAFELAFCANEDKAKELREYYSKKKIEKIFLEK